MGTAKKLAKKLVRLKVIHKDDKLETIKKVLLELKEEYNKKSR
jgi:hypothetical protein